MGEFDEQKLRRMLFQYPGATEENVEEALRGYAMRATEKRMFMEYRGMSNVMAERALDKLGYQRPPGWHSVFFYPGSMRPRGRYIAVALAAAIGLLLASCATPEQLVAQDRAQCASYGFQQGTPDFARCMMGMDQRRLDASRDMLDFTLKTNAETRARLDAQKF